jgi:hypothetical protein
VRRIIVVVTQRKHVMIVDVCMYVQKCTPCEPPSSDMSCGDVGMISAISEMFMDYREKEHTTFLRTVIII